MHHPCEIELKISHMTLRSVISGLILSATVGALGPYIGLYIQGSNATAYFTSQIAHVFLILLILVFNVIAGFCRRSWAFNRSELVVMFIMMSLANASPGIISFWVPVASAPFYHASIENNWHTVIMPHLPNWLVPHDLEAIRAFQEGSSQELTRIPWEVWLQPIMAWLPVLVALYVATISLMVILRGQWVEKERLIFPVIQLSLDMVRDGEGGSLLRPFFRNPVMWLGFSVPLVVGIVRGLHAYYPFLPTIDLTLPFPLFRTFLSFATLGFFFLVQREVAMGLWVFSLLNDLQVHIYHKIGWGTEPEAVVSGWSYGLPSIVHQGMGAMIVLVLGGLWVGREHISRVFHKAFSGDPVADDSGEILSYRNAVFGLLASLGVMLYWLIALGMPLFAAAAFLFFAFIVYIALTRVVVEGGVAVIFPPLVAPDAAISAIGTTAFGARGIVGLGFCRTFSNQLLNFAMSHVANGLKLSEQIEERRRMLFWGMLLAMLLGVAGAFWMLMYLA